jgi:hypothetical protein
MFIPKLGKGRARDDARILRVDGPSERIDADVDAYRDIVRPRPTLGIYEVLDEVHGT